MAFVAVGPCRRGAPDRGADMLRARVGCVAARVAVVVVVEACGDLIEALASISSGRGERQGNSTNHGSAECLLALVMA